MKLLKLLVLAGTALVLGQTNAHADVVLSVNPSSTSVGVGQIFTVGIYATGPTVTHGSTTYTSGVNDLASFQFDIAFNCSGSLANTTSCQPGASVLKALSVSEGAFLPNGGANTTFFEPGTIDNQAGLISNIGDVGLSGVSGSGTLVDITFQALTTGTSNISIIANSDLQFYDSNFNPITVADSVTTSPTVQTFPTNTYLSSSVSVTPEPSTAVLLVGPMLGLVVLTRKRLFEPAR